jgi:thymidine phosphorylase
VQAGAGVELHAKPGDSLRRGQPLLTLHTDDAARFDRAVAALDGAWEIAGSAETATPLVLDRLP